MNDTKEILFLIPYKSTRPYFSALYSECEARIYARLIGGNYRLIWRFLPEEGDDYEAKVNHILERESSQSDRIRLLVVAPRRSLALTQSVANWSSRLGIPVVALALRFQFHEPFGDRGIPYVVYTKGELAVRQLAGAAASELKTHRSDIEKYHLVLIPGEAERTDSVERIHYFEAGLREFGIALGPVVHLQECRWQRDLARSRFQTHIANSSGDIHVVFAANDEMALGVRDAIRANKGSKRVSKCLIYGFDEVSEVRTLIKSGDHNMKGTIGQNIAGMAEALGELIDRVLNPDPTRPPQDFPIPAFSPCLPDPPESFEQVVRKHQPHNSSEWASPGEAADMINSEVDKMRNKRSNLSTKSFRDEEEGATYYRLQEGYICRQVGDTGSYVWLRASLIRDSASESS